MPNPRKLNWYEITWRWAQCYINQRRWEQHLRRLSQKKCQNHDHKQQQFTLSWRIWGTRQCRAFIFGHHTEQQVYQIKSKCYLNVLHLEKKMMLPRYKKFLHVRRIEFQKKLPYSLSVEKVLILRYKNPSYSLSRAWKK